VAPQVLDERSEGFVDLDCSTVDGYLP